MYLFVQYLSIPQNPEPIHLHNYPARKEKEKRGVKQKRRRRKKGPNNLPFSPNEERIRYLFLAVKGDL
jgi:hypothetical protein